MVDREQYKKILLQKKQQILEEGGGVGQPRLAPFRDEVTDLSLADNHPADLGSEDYERGKDLALQEQRLSQLRRIEEALNRIEEGSYGTCLRCGREIPPERLEVAPEAPYCLACQGFEERRMGASRRPVEEGLLSPPFAQDGLPGDPGPDQEDIWQGVARFNKRPRIYTDGLEDEETGIVEETDKSSDGRRPDQSTD